jgi:GNAT superfamily N-acetyltransferase
MRFARRSNANECAVGSARVLLGEGTDSVAMTVLERLYLLYRFHGLGLGKRLMEEAVAYARANKSRVIALKVNAQSTRAMPAIAITARS